MGANFLPAKRGVGVEPQSHLGSVAEILSLDLELNRLAALASEWKHVIRVWHSAGHEPITKFVSTLITVIPHLREVLAIRRDFKVENRIQPGGIFVSREFLAIGVEHSQ